MFVNTLVLRTQITPDASFEDVLAQVREGDLGAFQHTDLPFEKVGRRTRPGTLDLRTLRCFQILIEFRNNALPQLELPGLSVSGVEFDLPVAKFDLQLSVTERYDADGGTDGIDAEFIYATDLFDGDLIDSFSRRLLTILEAVSREPSTSTGDIDVVSADERRQMLTEWNTHAEPAPADNIADRFFEAVAAHPSSTAVNDSDGAMTYAELDGRANRLARLLIGRGIGPESVVAVAMPRTTDLVLALVAVIKTGAAYLPVDITYPAERIAVPLRRRAAGMPGHDRRLPKRPTFGDHRIWHRRRRTRIAGDRGTPRSLRAPSHHRRGPDDTTSARRGRVHHLHLRIHRAPQRCPRSATATC